MANFEARPTSVTSDFMSVCDESVSLKISETPASVYEMLVRFIAYKSNDCKPSFSYEEDGFISVAFSRNTIAASCASFIEANY